MVTLPAIVAADPTLDALRVEVERRAALEPPRGYLGMSGIGIECSRRLWYGFRWADREQFGCDTLWRFEDGHRSEDVMAERLRMVPGINLRTIDPRTGQQFGFSDIGGHFKGHADGLITGLKQAPTALHVWEGKAVNEKKFAKLVQIKAEAGEKNALRLWDPIYYAQAVLYMAYAEAPRHYLTACTPGGRDMVSVRTDTALDEARRLRAKAERIITATELVRVQVVPVPRRLPWRPVAGSKPPHQRPQHPRNGWQWSLELRQVRAGPHPPAAGRALPAPPLHPGPGHPCTRLRAGGRQRGRELDRVPPARWTHLPQRQQAGAGAFHQQ